MSTTKSVRDRLEALSSEYERLRRGKTSLLDLIDEAEIAEGVYNSNAIENSTLTLKETERILLQLTLSREVSIREVFEAKNLAKVIEYSKNNVQRVELDLGLMRLLHQLLLTNVRDDIAGRFRAADEYVRVGSHIAPPPEHVERLLLENIVAYRSDHQTFMVDKVARFHCEFERIHPFVDGNGRVGRVLLNWQLLGMGFPQIIIRNKEKQKYYAGFRSFDDSRHTKLIERIVTLALMESLHKRLAYLRGEEIVNLGDFAKTVGRMGSAVFNAALRQTIPAFREKGIWKIAASGN